MGLKDAGSEEGREEILEVGGVVMRGEGEVPVFADHREFGNGGNNYQLAKGLAQGQKDFLGEQPESQPDL